MKSEKKKENAEADFDLNSSYFYENLSFSHLYAENISFT